MVAALTPQRLREMEPIRAPREQYKDLAELTAQLRAEQAQPTSYKLVGPHGESAVPETIFHILLRVAEVLAKGDAITIVPFGKELSTQQSADMLNVSRQYLVRLLDEKKIPCTKTGRHRKLKIEDVLKFKKQRDGERQDALDELISIGEEAGLYDELK